MTSFERNCQKTAVAVWDPEVEIAGRGEESRFLVIKEDEVLLVLEFPTRAALRRFVDKVASP